MSSNFVLETLENLVNISSSKRIYRSDYVPKGVPFYRSKEIIEKASGHNISSELFIDTQKFNNLKSKFGSPSRGDLLITSVGTLGIPYVVSDDKDFYFKDGNLIWFKDFSEELESNYLYYWLLSEDGKSELERHTIGPTQKAFTIQGLKKIKIKLPPNTTQKNIVKFLSDLDRKIELNRRMNETLMQIGQILFKHYFVDNPKSEIWAKVPMSEICEKIASGGTPATMEASYYGGDIDWYSTKELQDEFLFESEKTITDAGLAKSAAKLFPVNTVVMAIYAAPTVGRLGILSKESSFNQAACGLVAKASFGYEFIYLHLLTSRDILNNLANGAAQQNISVGKVRDFITVHPDEGTMNEFRRNVKPLFERIKNNSAEIRTLVNLRNSLLPRLLSGEISV